MLFQAPSDLQAPGRPQSTMGSEGGCQDPCPVNHRLCGVSRLPNRTSLSPRFILCQMGRATVSDGSTVALSERCLEQCLAWGESGISISCVPSRARSGTLGQLDISPASPPSIPAAGRLPAAVTAECRRPRFNRKISSLPCERQTSYKVPGGGWHFIRLSSQRNLKLKTLPEASCDQNKYSSFIHHIFIEHIFKIMGSYI